MEFKTLRFGIIWTIGATVAIALLPADELRSEPPEYISGAYEESYAALDDSPLGNVKAVFEATDGEPVVPEVITVGLLQSLNPATHCSDMYSCLRDNCELPRPEIAGCLPNCCDGLGVMGWFGNNAFKGISDQGAESNFGVVGGVNLAASPGRLGDRGIGIQFGGSYGAYDFSGRTASVTENSAVQEQIFLTFGAFHRAESGQRLQGGFVYDLMANDNWGTFSNEPFLTQWRAQGEYLLSDWNAVGLIVTRRDHGASQSVGPAIPGAVVLFRPVSQVSLFFHHRWDNGADSYLWLGIPEKQRPGDGPGSLGQSIVGTTFNVPVTDSLGVYTTGTYMRPSAGPGAAGAGEETWNIGAGLTWYPHGNAASPSVAGNCNMPYMPVANNGTFLVDRAIQQPEEEEEVPE